MTVLEEIALRQSTMYASLSVGLLFAAIYAVGFCYRGPSIPKTLVKAVPLLAFAVAGAVNFAAPLVVAGLALSALGDIALSRDGEKPFLVGLVAFASAHLLYILHFLQIGEVSNVGTLAIVAMVVFALSTEFWLIPHAGVMKSPVRLYVVLIAAMGLTALSLEGRDIAVWGAFAFLASDTILSIQLFRMTATSRWQVPASVSLWLLYALGQCAILIGAGFARPLFQI
ncbi:lysoplasmalogenase family protein [Shimia sp. SDUM112013]|uniref:lysoplasmalogenase family protein n=1 Tax=Shimia sp. SDUM112013 TaxID=3136160 RepID=UPI0032EF1D1F